MNPFKWDWQQRVSLFLAVVCIAYFVGHTSYKSSSSTAKTHPTAPVEAQQKSGDATTSGPESPAVTGSGNTITYDQPSTPEKKRVPAKKE
ncbi:MAG: hypothetical protein ABSB66_08500 [Candidatus Acidiferrales bacterium]